MTARLSPRNTLAFLSYPKVTRFTSLGIGFFILLWLSALAQAAQVTLAWDANTETDLAGYKLYYGTASGSYPNSATLDKVTTHTLSGLTEGVTYYFALTAFDTENFESGYSNEISYTPPAAQYILTASAGPNGTITPAGTVIVNPGTSATFTITAHTGYQIAAVTVDGAPLGAVSTYTFSAVTANHTIAATFTANTYSLTVSKTGTGTGTVTNTPAGTTFSAGTVVSLSAAPNAGSNFTGWSGACTGTANPCSVNMNVNQSVTANFTLKTYTLTASAGVNGSITPSGAVTVNHGESRTFTITPAAGYRVADVLVDGTSVGAVSTYTLSAVTTNHTIAAVFAANTYTLTVTKTGTGTGTVTTSPAGTAFSTGTVVTLTAAPGADSTFTGWSGACSGTANPCSLTVNNNHTVTANFNLKTYTLTASAGPNGTISPSGTVTVNQGTGRTFTITPHTGYRIAGVTVDGISVGPVSTYTFSGVTANHTIAAAFAANTYSLTVTKTGTGAGTVSNSPAGATFSAGTVVTLTAAPDAGSTFTGWSGACTGTANPCSLTMTAYSTVTAAFSLETVKPSSTISNPTPGATLRQLSCTIRGAAADGGGSGLQKVEVSTDGGTTWKQAVGTNAWTHNWNIPGNGSYHIKSRATDLAGNVETPASGLSVQVATYQPTPVTVTGKQLLVNGTPFAVKGVVYSPVPVGEDPNLAAPYGDYFTEPYGALHERDLPLLRTMGANALRLYHWEKTAGHSHFLDRAFNGGVDPLYVIAGFWIDAGLDLDPNSLGNVREQLKADFREMVAAHKTHPAILMWSVGHNLNQAGLSANQRAQVFSLINEMAETAQLEEGPSAHPVTTALADQDLAATVAAHEKAVPALDVWGANVYRGKSFGTLFSDLGPVTQKPLLIMEYGIDAFDQTRGHEYEKIGTPVQADYAEALWQEIAANGQTCLGGAIMSYSDEWWKARYADDPGCLPDPDPSAQGRCGFSTASQPDGYANEEWWGLVRNRP